MSGGVSNPLPEGLAVAVYGNDGTSYLILKVDDTGRLKVVVDTNALPTGAATAAHQATMITALQKIDDIQNALDSVGSDALRVMAGLEGTTYRFLNVDAQGHVQADVLSSALPTGAATSAKQTTIEAVLDTIAVPVPTMGYWKRVNASVEVANTTWTTIKEVTVGAGKIVYWMGFIAGMIPSNDPWQARLYEGANYFYEGYVAANPLSIDIGLLSKRVATETFKISAYQSTGAAKWMGATLTYIEVPA